MGPNMGGGGASLADRDLVLNLLLSAQSGVTGEKAHRAVLQFIGASGSTDNAMIIGGALIEEWFTRFLDRRNGGAQPVPTTPDP